MSTTRFAPPIYRPPLHRRQSVTFGALQSDPNTLFPALPGTYAITGVDATLVTTRVISADPGSYAITGTAATIVATRVLSADPGSYAITGTAATVGRELSFSADPGSYAITGVDATFGQTAPAPVPVILKAILAHTPKQRSQTSQAISGLAPALDYVFDAQPGLYNITYFVADIASAARTVDAQPTSYALTGAAATLEFSGIAAAPNVVLQAVKAHTPKPRKQVSQAINALTPGAGVSAFELDAQPGAFVITGFDVVTLYDVPGAAKPVIVRAVKQAVTPKPRTKVSKTFQQFTPVPELALDAGPGTFAITVRDANTTHDVSFDWDRIIVPNYAHQKWQIYYGSRQFYGVGVEGVWELDAQPGSLAISSTGNLLPNGDWETNTAHWEETNTGSMVRVSAAAAGIPAKYASNVLHITAPAIGDGIITDIDEWLPITGGVPYVFSCWFYSATPFNPNIAWTEHTAGGTTTAGTATGLAVQANTWTQISLTGTTQSNSALIEVEVYTLTTSSDFYIDGARLERGSVASSFYSGAEATFLWTHQFRAEPASFAVTGAAATLTYTPIATLSLNAEPGSYAITGSAPTLAAGRAFTASPGSYTLTGFATDTQLSKDLNALPGSYTVSGAAASFIGVWVLTASPGSLVLTASAARLARNDLAFSDHQPTDLTLTDHTPSTLTLTDI